MADGQAQTLLRHVRRLAGVEAEVSDGELVRRFAASRDESAFAALVDRHGPMVLAVCRRVLGNAHDAEDVFQAAFLTLARQAGALRTRESVGSWLYGVALRQALKARSAATRRRTREAGAVARPPAEPVAELTLREAQRILDAELSRLPEKLRAPIVLCCLEGKTRDEAAQCLGWTVALLKSRLEQARDVLRRRLCRRGVTLSAAFSASLLAEGSAGAAVPAALGAAVVRAAAAAPPLLVGRLTIAIAVLLAAGIVGGLHFAQPLAAPPGPVPVAANPQTREHRDAEDNPLPEGALRRLGSLRLRHPGRLLSVAASK
jgi:RNA polymerase sigma factor (sigma-70 family)